jgi:hypothetical protein
LVLISAERKDPEQPLKLVISLLNIAVSQYLAGLYYSDAPDYAPVLMGCKSLLNLLSYCGSSNEIAGFLYFKIARFSGGGQ